MKKAILLLLCALSPFAIKAQELISNIEQYHENSRWQKATAIDIFNDFAEQQHFKGNETVVDVCSGDGKITSQIAQQFKQGKVTGIDASDNMVKFSRAHYAGGNLHFDVMDATKLKFPADVDLITSFTCMHLIAQQKNLLDGFYQSLKPQGKVLMLFPVVHGFGKALDEVTTSKKWKSTFADFKPNWYFVNAQDYKALLNKAGFKIERVETFVKDETYPSMEAFKNSIRHWLPHLKILAPEQQAEFLKDLTKAYVKQLPIGKDGKLHYYVENMVVVAKKA